MADAVQEDWTHVDRCAIFLACVTPYIIGDGGMYAHKIMNHMHNQFTPCIQKSEKITSM